MEAKIYQLCFWLKDPGADQSPEEDRQRLEQFIVQSGGTILSFQPLEKRSVAYPIKKQRTGFWGEIVFSLAPDNLKQLEKLLRYESNLLRKSIFLVPPEKQRKATKIRRTAVAAELKKEEPKQAVSDKALETKLKEILGTEA